MKLLPNLQLRILLPLFLLTVALILTTCTAHRERQEHLVKLKNDSLENVTQDMTLLQGIFNNLLRKGDIEGLASVMSNLGSNPDIPLVLLIDDSGHISLSNEPKLEKHLAKAAVPAIDSGLIESVRETMRGTVMVSGSGDRVVGYYPVRMKPEIVGSTLPKPGIFYLEYDLARQRDNLLYDIQATSFRTYLLYFLAFLALGILLHFIVTKRLSSLLLAVNRFSSGELSVRADLRGRDELARLGSAFNDMAESIEKQHTELKQAEQNVRERNRFIESLINITPDILYIYDLKARRNIYCSAGIQGVLGYSAREIQQMGDCVLPELMHREDYERYRTDTLSIYARAKDGDLIKTEFRMHHKNGEWRWLESVEVIYERAKDGSPAQLFGVIRDVSERKHSEEEKLKLEVQARQHQMQMHRLESLGVLAGGIAHDFNNLLFGIFGYVEKARESAVNGRYQDLEGHLLQAGDFIGRAKDLTQQLLTFSKGGAPAKKTIDIRPVLEKSVSFALSGSNVVSDIKLPDDLWSCEADINQIAQVVDNIVRNAREAMPSGGTVTIRASNVLLRLPLSMLPSPGRYVRITIADTGYGISRENLGHIFDPFFTTKESGQGLGLSIVYSIIKRHGGSIEVDSTPGRGTVFTIFLPASSKSLQAEEKKADQSSLNSHGKILAMDDEPLLLDLISGMLTDAGYSVKCAVNGEEAIKLYKEAFGTPEQFNAVILDLTVRNGMGGRETIGELRKLDPNVRALVSSGYATDPVMANPGEYGFAGKIAKPYTVAEIKNAVAMLLSKNANP